ncbi:ABC transporter ATP-binding protein [Prochlorococcus marinus XMU1414]|uniref:ABC transporter ATP-binding protein/permease n=1 Tax=Prochlorococcus marinus XMU1424 TaxID=2774497 RepID=A0A9D9G4F6_PROMR|nr:ABC transporter ATP-binding protein/permease [Prochlorococcus marinus]MBO8228682.1 ABC transporter ATP-binding protein [Prochlorococcus marinus XMU1414]MBW3046161.1 ABC transporter ATP-binding protein [Prochlorococcus marinus str. MU1414]MCR8531547.1 ABC transporter ATP-binding protein/permease [Prochlorococcus marinus XMU1420]MCR8535276.1 ABC transporter ATP-binding protein/permease [Prochlorococcus marinus XMU1424]
MKKNFFKFPFYAKLYRKYLGNRIYIVFFLSLIAGLSESFGIAMLFPILNGLDNNPPINEIKNTSLIEGFDISLYINKIISSTGISDPRIAAISFILSAFLLKGLFNFISLSFNAYLRGELLSELKQKLLVAYSKMDYKYYLYRDAGYFINLVNDQITRALQSFYFFTQVGIQFINSIVYISLAFLFAWRFGIMSILIAAFLLFFFKKINNYVRHLSRMTAVENGILSNFLIQILHGFKYLKSTDQIKSLKEEIDKSIYTLSNNQIKTGIAESFSMSSREPILVALILVIVLFQLIFYSLPLAPIMVSILLFYRGLSAVLISQRLWLNMLEFAGSIEVVDEEFINQKKNEEKNNDVEQNSIIQNNLDYEKRGIKLKNIYFKYSKENDYILRNLNLFLPEGKSIALVGESGSGKSTIADIITLMLKPTKGEIFIDGCNSKNIDFQKWRKNIGYVSQESIIFNETIINNISLGNKKDKNYNYEFFKKVKKAAEKANISEFINSLPDGYDTYVGDRGVRLSGGQKQRLFIARELFRDPRLLILDEATSALDVKSEREVQQSIDLLKGKVTVIVIAHRLSTIKKMDKIYLLEKGRIIQEGNFRELSREEGSPFYKILNLGKLN